jgi:hypothetical protein
VNEDNGRAALATESEYANDTTLEILTWLQEMEADGLLKYTEPQTLARQRLVNLAPPGRTSYESFARAMTAALALLRRIGWR